MDEVNSIKVSRQDILSILKAVDEEIVYVRGILDANKRVYRRLKSVRRTQHDLLNEMDRKAVIKEEEGR